MTDTENNTVQEMFPLLWCHDVDAVADWAIHTRKLNELCIRIAN